MVFPQECVFAVQGHPRSLILVPIESAYVVRHNNLGPICTVSEILQVFVLMTPLLFHPIWGVFPLHQIAHVGMSSSINLKLFGREIISKYSNLYESTNSACRQCESNREFKGN